MYRYLLLLCMAVSSYVHKGVSASAFDCDSTHRPAYYGDGVRPRGCKIDQHAIAWPDASCV